ncbi:MAG: hypothetical protein IKM66_06435 [Clostridia bacterium]|nr:hypothetical protein [Clostridia bacterium]
MKTKKLLSLVLSVIMIMSVLPMYASAAAETLTASNIQTLPTITMKENVTVYTGNYQDTVFSVADDEVVVDAAGNQVAGHFVIRNSSVYSAGEFTIKNVNLTFLPDDIEAYTSFNKNRVTITPVTVIVEKADLALKDAENDYPKTAEAVPSGTAISDIRITGGACYIVQAPTTTSYVANLNWTWQDTSLTVTESGYYNAVPEILPGNFNDFVLPVYIEVENSVKATTIVEAPTATIEYGQAWNEVVFECGKVMAGDTEVSGTFTRKLTGVGKPSAGVYDSVPVIFTPDDLEKYAPSEGYGTVTVTKANYKFVNENGEEIVPEITLPYGTTFDIGGALGVALKLMIKDRNSVSNYDIPVISFPDYDKDDMAPVGTNTYNVRIRPYSGYEENTNYNVTDLQFILTIEPVVLELALKSEIDDEDSNIRYYYLSKMNYNDPTPQGTYTYYVDGELTAENVGMGYKVKLAPENSGAHEIKIVYIPTENDPCIIEDINRTVNIRLLHKLTRGNLVMGGSPEEWFGDEVTLRANMLPENFGGWRITDANGNEITLEGAVIEGINITFTMPDYDITVEAIDKSQSSIGGGDAGDGTDDDSNNGIFGGIWSFFQKLINWFSSIIKQMMSLFGLGA